MNLRKKNMENCPDDFKDELNEFVDGIETKLKKIQSLIDIKSIYDLNKIEDAYTGINDLLDDIY